MQLFKHVANKVEQHGRLVERQYGERRIGKVIERVQMETDYQREIIIDRQCSQRGSLSVLRIGPGQTTNRSPSSPGENLARGQWLEDGGRGWAPQPDCRVSQSVKPDRSLQTPTDAHRCPQIPAGPDKSPQMPAGPDRSPLFSTIQAGNL